MLTDHGQTLKLSQSHKLFTLSSDWILHIFVMGILRIAKDDIDYCFLTKSFAFTLGEQKYRKWILIGIKY